MTSRRDFLGAVACAFAVAAMPCKVIAEQVVEPPKPRVPPYHLARGVVRAFPIDTDKFVFVWMGASGLPRSCAAHWNPDTDCWTYGTVITGPRP